MGFSVPGSKKRSMYFLSNIVSIIFNGLFTLAAGACGASKNLSVFVCLTFHLFSLCKLLLVLLGGFFVTVFESCFVYFAVCCIYFLMNFVNEGSLSDAKYLVVKLYGIKCLWSKIK